MELKSLPVPIKTDGINSMIFDLERGNSGKISLVKTWLKRNKIHILAWFVYAVYESVIIGFISGRFGKIENYLVHYTLNISFFYLHVYLLGRIGFTNRTRDYLKLVLLALTEITIYVFVLAVLNHIFTSYNQANEFNSLGIDKIYVMSATYRSLFFIMISTGYWFSMRYVNERKKSEALEKEKLYARIEKEKIQKDLVLAQNAFLRTQINPHFLFNTLSFIRGRIRKTDPFAGEMIVGLAEMMRYAIDIDYRQEFILISEEIEQVNNLIDIFQAKQQNTLQLVFSVLPDDHDCYIIPLALMTLVENVFKHGLIDDPERPAKITIYKAGDRLIVETQNHVNRHALSPSSKTGLANLQSRLHSVYGDAIEFFSGGEENFSTYLSIPWLTDISDHKLEA